MFLALLGGKVQIVTDQFFEYTTLLLPGNGTNGATNNTFLDGSTNNFTITRNGNTTQGTFSPFSQTGWGNYFDGTGDSLSIANNVALQLTGAFTMEAWYYPLGFPGSGLYDCLLTTGDNSLSNAIAIYINSSGGIQLYNHVTNAAIFNTASGVVLNAWNHIAATRNSSNGVDLWLNGVSQGSTVTVSSSFTSTTPTRIGTSNTNQDCYGYISNVRIVKGVAVYTGAFTPPTSPLAATQSAGTNISAITGTQTSLLTCQSNRFIDNSTNNFTITVNGNTSVVAFSPFNPTASWSAATYGGSGYFDGSGDYLQLPAGTAFAPGTGDFTVDGWFYTTVTTANQIIWSQAVSGTNYFIVWADPSTSTVYFNGTLSGGGVNISSTANLQVNAWNYFSVRRASGTVTVYLNGVAGTPTSNTVDFSNTSYVPTIGRYTHAATNHFTGYIANLRYVKGTAITPSGVPTTLNTAVSGTSALLNFTNAGIYDATSKNDLETVGNAQISTAQFKFSPSSIAFDGTGDYLTSNPATTDMYAFGSGDFTIEFWLRLNTVSGTQVVYDQRPTSGGVYPAFFMSGSTLTYFVNGVSRITTTLSSGIWYHIALSRSGTSTKLFVNGAQAGSTYTDSNVYLNTALRPVLGADATNFTSNWLNGYLQDVRVTKGYARYTANFTTPTSAFPTL